MADYRREVLVTANVAPATREVEKLVRRLDRIDRAYSVKTLVDTAGLARAKRSLAQLQASVANLNKTPLNILTGTGAGSEQRTDTFRRLSQGAKDFFNSIASGNKNLASTTAGLQQQAAAFKDLADNISFTNQSQKRYFRDFTQGAEMARAKASGAVTEQLRALQDLYERGTSGFKQDIKPSAGGLTQLLNLGKDLPRTKAALSEYRSELERVYDLVGTRSQSGGIIAVEISNVEKELLKIEKDRAEAIDQINGVTKAGYALTKNQLFLEEENLATIERRTAARRREQQAANDLYNRARSVSREFGVNPAMALRPAGVSDEEVALRNLLSTQGRLKAIEEENLAAVERRVGARQAEVAAANELVRAQRLEAADAYRRDRALSREFGVNPAMALRPAGMNDAEVARANLIATRTQAARESSSFYAFSQQIEQEDPKIQKSIERNRVKIERDTAREALAQAAIANQASARARAVEFRRTGGLSFDERLALVRPDLAPGAARPAPGFFRGDMRKALGEGLIGGAFPLLFGQGAGASVGGLAGGFAGGAIGGSFGFGLSLAGTAIGQVVDNTAKNLGDLASALKSPDQAMAALETSGFRVSDSLKFQVQQLQSVGRAYDAQTLVLREVEKRLGEGGVRNLNALSSEQKRLQDQSAAVASTIQGQLLPALVGFTAGINDVIAAAAGIGDLPGVKQIRAAQSAINQNPVGRAVTSSLSPFGVIGQLFGAAQDRGRAIAATSAGNRRALSPQEAFANETAAVQESRRIADQIQSAYRESFNLQRQAHDLQYDGAKFNKEVADYIYGKERQIFDMRQQAAEQQVENARAASQNRIERGDLSARQMFAAAVGFEQQLLSNVREVVRARKEGEADIEQSRNRLELAMAKLNRDVEDYKRTNAREVEDIERRKLSYVRSVEDYKMRVADHVRDRAREAADLFKQAMTLPTVGAAPAGAPAAGAGGAMNGGSKLSRLIGSVESYGGNYGAFNRGGSNQGHTAHGSGVDPNLVNMTIAEIQRRQLAPGVPASQQLHAVGKYQIIGSTMRSLMRGAYGPTGVAAADRFTPEVQERLGAALARNRVMGRSTEQAMRGLRQEWVGLQYAPDAKLREAVIEMQKTGGMAPSPQAQASTQISNIPAPTFKPTPIGPTPSAAPLNAANLAAAAQLAGGESEALRILEGQVKLRQKGVELGQIEQILQTNQLPQLQQQGEALKQQIDARQRILGLTDNAASMADIEAEASARIKQIELDRSNALAGARKKYGNDLSIAKQINTQADTALRIAKGEEAQRRVNLERANQLQVEDRVRSEILQLQEDLSRGKAEAAALERGELQASAVELLKASGLYQQMSDAQREKVAGLVVETEELRKQNDFRRSINEMRRDRSLVGAGLRAGFVGTGARAFEQGMKDFNGDSGRATQLAREAQLLESQQLIWQNLEKNIVDTSSAISGGLTNGLLDIVSGSKKIGDVGREMLNNIARSFADSAQQQLNALLQRQLGGMLGGAGGPLTRMIGAGAEVAGPQALGAASMAASGQLAMFGAALQAVTAQMALSGAMGGAGSAFSGAASTLLGSAAPSLIPGFSPTYTFGGFFANGGVTRPGEAYVVGDGGEPEFFFPGTTGRVVPQSKLAKADQLRAQSQQDDTIDINYTVIEEAGRRYVTEDQFRKGMDATSRRTKAATLAGLRNNKAEREYVNI